MGLQIKPISALPYLITPVNTTHTQAIEDHGLITINLQDVLSLPFKIFPGNKSPRVDTQY